MLAHQYNLLRAIRVWLAICVMSLASPHAGAWAETPAGNGTSSVAVTVAANDITSDAPTEVTIAVLAFRGEDAALRKWQPTADYLSAQIPGHVFRIITLSLSEMMDVVERGSVDFILTNPGNYVEHEARHGVVRIATLKPIGFRSAGNKFGAVVFTRAERTDITTLEDLRGKRFMAIKEDAFGGFQMAWREMQAQGVDPFKDLGALIFAGFPQDNIVDAVLSGEVDAGTCRTGVLENLADEERIDFHDIRILNSQEVPGFQYALSTRLYPEWPFAQLKHTPEDLSQKVVVSLLSMGSDHPAAMSGGYAGWTVPLDYQPVHDLFRELHIGPYGAPVNIRLSDLVEQYWHWAMFAGVLLGVGVLWMVRIEYLVAQRTSELSTANAALEDQIVERKRAEDIARERQNELAHVSRVNTMGELTASLAHEINQPLAAIANYATGSVRRIDRGIIEADGLKNVLSTIAGEAERAGEVIRRVRALVRKGEVNLTELDLNA
ncbi:MAG TPA: PhnD/SsuA/transferrin family substrate-binding protein, partial [Magnetovibrio sp.]